MQTLLLCSIVDLEVVEFSKERSFALLSLSGRFARLSGMKREGGAADKHPYPTRSKSKNGQQRAVLTIKRF